MGSGHSLVVLWKPPALAGGRTSTKNVQINSFLPPHWKTELENLARVFSVEEEATLTYLDLIRRAIQEKYAATQDKASSTAEFTIIITSNAKSDHHRNTRFKGE